MPKVTTSARQRRSDQNNPHAGGPRKSACISAKTTSGRKVQTVDKAIKAQKPAHVVMIGNAGLVTSGAAPFVCGKPYQRIHAYHLPETLPQVQLSPVVKSGDGLLTVTPIEIDDYEVKQETTEALDYTNFSKGADHVCLVVDGYNVNLRRGSWPVLQGMVSRIESESGNRDIKRSVMISYSDGYDSEEEYCKSLEKLQQRFADRGTVRGVINVALPKDDKAVYPLCGPMSHKKYPATSHDAQQQAKAFFTGAMSLDPVQMTEDKADNDEGGSSSRKRKQSDRDSETPAQPEKRKATNPSSITEPVVGGLAGYQPPGVLSRILCWKR